MDNRRRLTTAPRCCWLTWQAGTHLCDRARRGQPARPQGKPVDGPSGSRVPHRSPALTRPPWTTVSGCPPRACRSNFFQFFNRENRPRHRTPKTPGQGEPKTRTPKTPRQGNQRHSTPKTPRQGNQRHALRKQQGRGTTKDTHSENTKAGGTTKDTGLRKHQGRGAGFCLSGRGADTWAGLHLAREQRACAPAPAGAMPWCWRCRCWWHWPPSRVAALALVTAFPALGLINIVYFYWHDYCGLQYLCHACMIAFAYVVSREADLALSVLVVSGGGLIVRCGSSGESCSV